MASAATDIVSVIIVTHNSESVLPDCLKSINTATRNLSAELIVVDNNSNSDPEDTVREHFSESSVIHNKRNTGFAAACNQGATKATGKYLLFVNPDLIVDPDSIEKLKEVCQSDKMTGMVAARLRFADGSFQPSCRNFPTVRNLLFSRGSSLTAITGGKASPDNEVYTLGDFSETTTVPAVAGTMIMTRAETFRHVGGFDQRFFMYLEDTDICFRLHSAGYTNYFVPQAGAVHDWGHGSTAGKFRRKFHHHRSIWLYFLKHGANGFSLIMLPFLLAINFVLVMILPERKRGNR